MKSPREIDWDNLRGAFRRLWKLSATVIVLGTYIEEIEVRHGIDVGNASAEAWQCGAVHDQSF
eukprot:2933405-Heterocapsa_arctica.AAC.1